MAVVWQLSVRHHKRGSSVKGVILKDSAFFYRNKRGGLINMLRVLHSYFIKPLAHAEVTLQIEHETVAVRTDTKGAFKIELGFQPEYVNAILLAGSPLEIGFDYPIVFHKSTGNYEVISDIDDTIMISYTADTLKRVWTLLFTDPLKRRRIEYTFGLSNHLSDLKTRFNYISKSESNLFSIISSFIRSNSFPQGELYLTPYLSFGEMLTGKKQPGFKEATIKQIIDNSDKEFILVGDDSQLDMDIYANIVETYGNRIFRVYIRQTKKRMTSRASANLSRLNDSGAQVIVFNDKDIFSRL